MEQYFKTSFAEEIFNLKYRLHPYETWADRANIIVDYVCGTEGGKSAPLLCKSDLRDLEYIITYMKFIPAGRYIYYAGRLARFYNNCYAFIAEEDTREEWGRILHKVSDALMTGGGITVEYSKFRARGEILKSTGGVASGPIPLMYSVNEVARNVQQGGSRRSAAGATLHWKHKDINEFIHTKDWPYDIKQLKAKDVNFPAPLDMSNISIRWDTEFHRNYSATSVLPKVWYDSVIQMCKTGEPGHYYNFYDQEYEIARNVCGEFISDEDSDCCNLGSVNLANIESKAELRGVVGLASKFLLCGTMRSKLPNNKICAVRNRTRKIGLGPMGFHEWLLQRSMPYACTHELHQWLSIYQDESEASANDLADKLSIPRPERYRAVAPAGSIGAMAATTTGIEPLFSVAYKRRYLKNGTKWVYQYVIDPIAKLLMEKYGFDPDKIETAASLAKNPMKRILFQAEVQKYVDMGISSTINLPEWGTQYNNETTAEVLALTLATMCDSLRGITMYPENARGGQPLTPIPYKEAIKHEGEIFEEVVDNCKSGMCGI